MPLLPPPLGTSAAALTTTPPSFLFSFFSLFVVVDDQRTGHLVLARTEVLTLTTGTMPSSHFELGETDTLVGRFHAHFEEHAEGGAVSTNHKLLGTIRYD